MAIALRTRKYGGENTYTSGLSYVGDLGSINYKGTSPWTVMMWVRHGMADQAVWQAGWLFSLLANYAVPGSMVAFGSRSQGKHTITLTSSDGNYDKSGEDNQTGNWFCVEETGDFGAAQVPAMLPLDYTDPMWSGGWQTQWYHYALRVTPNEPNHSIIIDVFFNGEWRFQQTFDYGSWGVATWLTPDTLIFGSSRWAYNITNAWNGKLAYARIFNSSLTDEQIAVEKQSVTATVTPWGDWPLISDLNDVSGNNHHLSYLPGTPAVEGIYAWDLDAPVLASIDGTVVLPDGCIPCY